MPLLSERALNYVRLKATEVMSSTCRVEHVDRPYYDQIRGTATTGNRTVIYEGPCRVWESSAGTALTINEEDIMMQPTQISLPWDIDPIPQHEDEILITDSLTDAQMIGQRFAIVGNAYAGELRATRRFTVTGSDK